MARAFVGFTSIALLAFALWVLNLCFQGVVPWGYYSLALVPLALAVMIWPRFHRMLPLWLTLTTHVLVVVTFTLNGIAGIFFGLGENRRATVRGISGEWREYVAVGLFLLIMGVLHGIAVWAAQLHRKSPSTGPHPRLA